GGERRAARAQGAGGGGRGLDGGDDDGCDPAQGDGAGRRAPVPGGRGERLGDEAPVRQSLRHRPVHARRHPARDELPDRREHGGRGGVWVVGAGGGGGGAGRGG